MNSLSTTKNFKLALTGLFSALCILLSVTPFGYIKLGFINITVVHIPVILAAVLSGFGPAVATGFVFGLTSCIRSAMFGTPYFYNPLVSILPRILFAISAWAIYTGLNVVLKGKVKPVAGAIAAGAGTFLHTLYVMTMVFVLFAQTLLGGLKIDATGLKGYFIMLGTMYATNGIWEILGATIITAAVLSAIFVAANGKSKLSMESDEE